MSEHIDQLKNYIREQLHAGFTADEVATHIHGANWQEDDIHQAFAALQSEMMPSSATSGQHAASSTPPRVAASSKGRIRTGWQLLMQSLRILKANKRLVRFTIMSSIWSFIAVTVMLVAAFWVAMANHAAFANNESGANIFVYSTIIVMYVVLFFIANLYAAGLTACVLDIFHGQRKAYRDYMHQAWHKAPALLLYALIESTVGLLLRFIAERVRFVGWLISRILGALWSLGTMFVIPLIVTDDNPNAFSDVKKSMGLFKSTWGEGVTTKITVGVGLFFINMCLFFGFLILGGLSVFAAGSLFGDNGASVVAIAVVTLWFICILLLAIIGNIANSILNVALYYYATTGSVPPAFDANLLNSVFVANKRRGLFGRKK